MFDLIIASMSITEKRMEKIDFTGPYRFSTGQIIGSRPAKSLVLKKPKSIYLMMMGIPSQKILKV